MGDRTVTKLFAAAATPEGQGVTVYRTIGRRELDSLDPFLLLDEMLIDRNQTGVGFPEHPHRGFETVTYMLSGSMQHKDTVGNIGEIGPGEAQWMTAGRGIVHSEMPTSKGVDIRGFQLWVNLPSTDKMKAPRYQDVTYNQIPTVQGDGFQARLITGSLLSTDGPVQEIAVKPLFADITMTHSGNITLPVPLGHTAFIYGIDSDFSVSDQPVPTRTLAVLSDGDNIKITGEKNTRFLLVAGAPIGEPIARHGPFVMNTRDEIIATMNDWNQGRFLNAS
jgi:redox-sensitive bicupin YhaK (pirin superfamily)